MTEPRDIVLRDPCLVLLVGAAGSGKSTFAARHFAPGEILSSDAFRELVSGDPGDQAATGAAFAALHRELERRLAHPELVVVDATNVRRHARRELLRRAAAAGVTAAAIVLDLPPAVVLARNAARPGRVVPETAVRRQLADLARALRPGGLEAEGIGRVARLCDPADVDRVHIVRRRSDDWAVRAVGGPGC